MMLNIFTSLTPIIVIKLRYFKVGFKRNRVFCKRVNCAPVFVRLYSDILDFLWQHYRDAKFIELRHCCLKTAVEVRVC